LVEPERDVGRNDVRLLSLLPSLAFVPAPVVGTAGGTGKESRLTSARTGCGLKSDMGRALPEPERTALGSSAIGSADATSTQPKSSASGARMSASACALPSETSVEHVESGDDGRSSVPVMGNWKETRRVLGTGGDSRSNTPSNWDCGPTSPGGASASVGGGRRVDCGRSCPMMRMVGGVPGTGVTPGEVATGDWAIGLRMEKRERGRRVDGVGVVLIGSSRDETERRDLDGGRGAQDTRASFAELSFSLAARRLQRRNMREKGEARRVPNMVKCFVGKGGLHLIEFYGKEELGGDRNVQGLLMKGLPALKRRSQLRAVLVLKRSSDGGGGGDAAASTALMVAAVKGRTNTNVRAGTRSEGTLLDPC
jgi:hypothetical protein